MKTKIKKRPRFVKRNMWWSSDKDGVCAFKMTGIHDRKRNKFAPLVHLDEDFKAGEWNWHYCWARRPKGAMPQDNFVLKAKKKKPYVCRHCNQKSDRSKGKCFTQGCHRRTGKLCEWPCYPCKSFPTQH